MNYIRVGTGVPKINIGDCKFNQNEIIKLINKAVNEKTDILLFPELSISGYTCGDLFLQESLLDDTKKSVNNILEYTNNKNIIIIIGGALKFYNNIYNTAIIIFNGEILGIVPKINLSLEEKRWFSSNYDFDYVNILGEDIPFGRDLVFEIENGGFGIEFSRDLDNLVPPSSLLSLNGASMIFNLASFTKNNIKEDIKSHSKRINTAYIYLSPSIYESTTDHAFSGYSGIWECGNLLGESTGYNKESDFLIKDLDLDIINSKRKNMEFESGKSVYIDYEASKKDDLYREISKNPFIKKDTNLDIQLENIVNKQTIGLFKRLNHIGSEKSVLGVSGGLDSTLALLITVNTYDFLGLSRDNIIGIIMPGFGTSDRTLNNANLLCDSLNISKKIIDIKEASKLHFKDIGHDIDDHSIVFENTQARERTQILMDYGNKINGIMVGSGNMSELALGFTTYNGDHMSMYDVNSGVPKTIVRKLVKFFSEKEGYEKSKEVLNDILGTPISPELLPPTETGEVKQKTEEILGSYDINDFYMYYVVKYGLKPEKILFMVEKAFGNTYTKLEYADMLKNFYIRFTTQQFKRSCMPDGVQVLDFSLSPRGGQSMPSDASFKFWTREVDEIIENMK